MGKKKNNNNGYFLNIAPTEHYALFGDLGQTQNFPGHIFADGDLIFNCQREVGL